MKPYHYAWLMRHPERTSDWLKERLKDGFDVHHVDFDHGNNDPTNLVLIECGDHMMIHGSNISRIDTALRQREEESRNKIELGKVIYEKRMAGLTWRECFMFATGLDDSVNGGSRAVYVARRYDESADLEFPPILSGARAGC